MRGGRLPTFFSPAGIVITRDHYKELKAQTPDPYLIHQFENEKVVVELRHIEKIFGARDVPREHWKMFEMLVTNIISTDYEGNEIEKHFVKDEFETKEYRTREELDAAFKSFMVNYTDSKFNEKTGEFVEVGNKLAPPDPDVPVVSEESPAAQDFGSW